MKRPDSLGDTFAKPFCDEELVSRVYQELSQLNNRGDKAIFLIGKRFEQIFH